MKKGEWGHFEWQPYFFWLIYHPQKSMDGYETLRQDEDVVFYLRRVLGAGGRTPIAAWLMCWVLCREVWKQQPCLKKLILLKTNSKQRTRNTMQEGEREGHCCAASGRTLLWRGACVHTDLSFHLQPVKE